MVNHWEPVIIVVLSISRWVQFEPIIRPVGRLYPNNYPPIQMNAEDPATGGRLWQMSFGSVLMKWSRSCRGWNRAFTAKMMTLTKRWRWRHQETKYRCFIEDFGDPYGQKLHRIRGFASLEGSKVWVPMYVCTMEFDFSDIWRQRVWPFPVAR